MIKTSAEAEKQAMLKAVADIAVAARTAPKACGVDVTDSLILDGEDKDRLTAKMRELGEASGLQFFIRDAGNVDNCHCIILLGSKVGPRGLSCKLCGKPSCAEATKAHIPCAMAVHDLGIAVGSAAATAMDKRIDNRVLFTAGMAALALNLFGDEVKIAFGIGLSTGGKNIFFDRPMP